jgi:hypothetical protein
MIIVSLTDPANLWKISYTCKLLIQLYPAYLALGFSDNLAFVVQVYLQMSFPGKDKSKHG